MNNNKFESRIISSNSSRGGKGIRVIAVTGGKGGVGKTHVSINLASQFSKMGKQVMLLDADFGLSNVDIALGLHSTYDLSHVLNGECSLDDILIEGPFGIKVVPGSSGIQSMCELNTVECAGLISAFSGLSHKLDTLIIDTASGIYDPVLRLCAAAQEVLVVVCDEPSSITDAYAIIKLMNQQYGVRKFRILANLIRSNSAGRELFAKLTKVTEKFLNLSLHYVGSVPEDECAKEAIKRQKTLLELFPGSKGARAFKNVAEQLNKIPLPSMSNGQLEFFVEQFVNSGIYQANA